MPFCKEKWRVGPRQMLFVQMAGSQYVARRCRLALQNGLFENPKRHVSQPGTARFAAPFGVICYPCNDFFEVERRTARLFLVRNALCVNTFQSAGKVFATIPPFVP